MVNNRFFKKKSKRISTRKRTKIERKVREHKRKVKKNEKKQLGTKRKKDPGVPNSFPMKDQVLKEAEERKRRLEEERERQKQRRKKERAKMLNKKRNLSSLVQDAQRRAADFERKADFVEDNLKNYTGGKAVESSLKAYYKEFRKVIDAADVILEVLDARDPLGSRCPQVEQAVLAAGHEKKLVLLLNKIDLVPKDNAEKWLKYLRNEFPTLAFKASTQTQSQNLSQVKIPLSKASEDLVKSSRCLGADMLMKLLGNYCRKQDIRATITVGVVGFPNTGKSSIINSLKRSKACNVGSVPGVTKCMQEVQLDKHVKLVDSPGVVMATGTSDAAVILRNCVKVEAVEDVVAPVEAILKRCNKHQMMLHYSVPHFKDVNEFLALLARRFGRLRKGGVPDITKAGRIVLQDWNLGKITYYTHPPEQHTLPAHLDAAIVTEMTQAFDIDALLSDEQETLKNLKIGSTTDIVLPSSELTDGIVSEEQFIEAEMNDKSGDEIEEEEEDEEEEEMDETEDVPKKDELHDVTVPVSRGKSRTSSMSSSSGIATKTKTVLKSSEGSVQLNRARKKDFKKMKKDRKRADALAGQLSTALSGALEGLGGGAEGDDYDFSIL